MPGQPCPPLALHRHARPDRQDRHQDAQTGEQQEKQRLHPERGTVPATERIEKIAAPVIQPILQRQLQHGTADEHGGDEPGR
jgi:hypothetical protein